MNIQAQKALIIEQFKQVNDTNLINAIKNLLDNASQKEQKSYLISEENQKLVMDRFENVRNNPENLLDWEDAKKSLKDE